MYFLFPKVIYEKYKCGEHWWLNARILSETYSLIMNVASGLQFYEALKMLKNHLVRLRTASNTKQVSSKAATKDMTHVLGNSFIIDCMKTARCKRGAVFYAEIGRHPVTQRVKGLLVVLWKGTTAKYELETVWGSC